MIVIRVLSVMLLAGCAVAQSELCPSPDPLRHTVHLPHPQDCAMFLRCDHGVPKPERCPGLLHFNPVLQVCDWPERAGCTNVYSAGAGDSNEWDANLEPQKQTLQEDVTEQGNRDEFIPGAWVDVDDDVQNEAVQDEVVADGGSSQNEEVADKEIFEGNPEFIR